MGGWKDRAQKLEAQPDGSGWRSRAQSVDAAPSPKQEDPGVLETLLHQGLAGYFKQGSDELAGQISRLKPGVQGNGIRMPDGSVKLIENGDDAAAAGTALERENLKHETEAHPIASFLANVGGELASDATLKGLIPGLPVGSLPYQLTSGAVSGALGSDAQTTAGRVGGAAFGAGAALVGHGLGQYVVGPALARGGQLAAKAADALPESVRNFAKRMALQASGYEPHDIKPIARKDIDLALDRGEELLREGNIKAFTKPEDIVKGTEASVEKYGEAIGRTLEAADTIGKPFDMRRFVDRARKEILDPIKDDPIMEPEAMKLSALLDKYEQSGGIGFQKANDMKGNIQTKINWGNFWNDAKADVPNDIKIKLQGVMLDEVDNQLGEAFSSLGQQGQRIRDAFKEIKRRFGVHSDALDKAKKFTGKEFGKGLSVKDLLVGQGIGGASAGAALASGNPLLAAGLLGMGGAGALASKAARERGPSTLAVGANKLANVLDMAANSSATKWLVKVPAEALEEYAAPLASAAAKGPQALATTMFVLSQQDPKFRALKGGPGSP